MNTKDKYDNTEIKRILKTPLGVDRRIDMKSITDTDDPPLASLKFVKGNLSMAKYFAKRQEKSKENSVCLPLVNNDNFYKLSKYQIAKPILENANTDVLKSENFSKDKKDKFFLHKNTVSSIQPIKNTLLCRLFNPQQANSVKTAYNFVRRKKSDTERDDLEKPKNFSISEFVSSSNEIYQIGFKTKLIQDEINRLIKQENDYEKRLNEIQKQKLNEFFKHRASFDEKQKIIDELNEKVIEKTARKAFLDKEIWNKIHFLNSQKNENKKIEERFKYYYCLKEFLDNIAPSYWKEKKEKDM